MKFRYLIASSLLLLPLTSVFAQNVTLEWSGEVLESSGDTPIQAGTTFTASATFDTTQTPYDVFYYEPFLSTTHRYIETMLEFSFTIYDPSGQPMSLTVPNNFGVAVDSAIYGEYVDFEMRETGQSYIFGDVYFPHPTSGYQNLWFSVQDVSESEDNAVLTSLDGFPTFNQFSVGSEEGISGQIYVYTEGDGRENFFLNITQLGEVAVDEDGDGVAGDADLCPISNTDEAVSFGDLTVDVENAFDANGCSIMDHYAACVVPEEEQPVRGIRSVRSGPSSCEKAVAYDLVADGVISYAEARILRSALYQAIR